MGQPAPRRNWHANNWQSNAPGSQPCGSQPHKGTGTPTTSKPKSLAAIHLAASCKKKRRTDDHQCTWQPVTRQPAGRNFYWFCKTRPRIRFCYLPSHGRKLRKMTVQQRKFATLNFNLPWLGICQQPCQFGIGAPALPYPNSKLNILRGLVVPICAAMPNLQRRLWIPTGCVQSETQTPLHATFAR